MATLPLPPAELRMYVGPLEDSWYDNPTGALLFPELPAEAYESVLDWGSGCGRLARQLIQQHVRPRRYVGLDIHREMSDWCRNNLAPCAPGFSFLHHDDFNPVLNPSGSKTPLPFPVEDRSIGLFLAWSVFTHVNELRARFYLNEVARVLRPNGHAFTTWFLFDKSEFPMMLPFENSLFISESDPTHAVIFDRTWLRETLRSAGLVPWRIIPPAVRGFQWCLFLAPAASGVVEVEYPPAP